MTEYKIDIWSNSFNFSPPDIIFIASADLSKLSDKEISDYTADSITHEFLHKLLWDMYGMTICGLFDAIEQNFRTPYLLEKIYSMNTGRETYSKFITRAGFKAFLEHYHISNNDFNQAHIICNRRLKCK